MTWAEVARAVGVSASTIQGLRTRAVAEGDGVLQLLRWLGRSAESFTEHGAELVDAPTWPGTGESGTLRFDTEAIYRALAAERDARTLTWKAIAAELGTTPSALTRLEDGGRVHFPWIMRVFAWLGRRSEEFVRLSYP